MNPQQKDPKDAEPPREFIDNSYDPVLLIRAVIVNNF